MTKVMIQQNNKGKLKTLKAVAHNWLEYGSEALEQF